MKKLENNFTQIPNSILFSGNHTHVVIWGIIRHFETMEKGICRCSRDTIANLAKLSESQLKRHLSAMENLKLIERIQTPGGVNQYKTIWKNQNRPTTNNDTIFESGNTGNVCRGRINEPTTNNDTSFYNEGGAKMSRGGAHKCAGGGRINEPTQYNDIESNNIENNNIHNHNHNHNQDQERAGALSSIVSSLKNDDFIFSDYLRMFGDNIYPWSKCAPDRLYHYAKKKGYCMTLAEIYKFLLVIAAGAYYKDGVPVIVNNYDTLLKKWKNKQSEAGKKFSEENNLESVTYQHNRTAEENNIPLQTVKIPYCNKGILEIRRYKPILAENEISRYSGDYMEEIDFYPDGKKEKIQRWKHGF